MQTKKATFLNLAVLLAMFVSLAMGPAGVQAAPAVSRALDLSAQPLPYSQNWTDIGLITADDNWSLVPGVMGYQGNYASITGTGKDPRMVLDAVETSAVSLFANLTDVAFTTGGVAEFELANPTIALAGSGTAKAPFVLFSISTIGKQNIHISYNLRDIDDSPNDDTNQQVALQYRIGGSGTFTNVPDGYVADASTGPGLATLVTPVSVPLPAALNNQPLVQIRIITTNAPAFDEWIGVDDVSITGDDILVDNRPTVISTTPANGATSVAATADVTVNFSEEVTAAAGAFQMACGGQNQSFALSNSGSSYTLNPDADLPFSTLCTVTVTAANVSDLDVPVETLEADYLFSFTTAHDPDAIVPIAEARAAGAGFTGWIQGSVTTPPGIFTKAITIQDATGGMYVYALTLTFPELTLGDLVKVRGTLKNYNGMLEVDPTTEVIYLGPSTAPAPEAMATSAVAGNQGKLVSVTGTVTWTGTPPSPGAANFTFSINDGSGPVNVFINKATGLDMTGFTLGQQMQIIGISGAFTTPQILPRFQTDLIDLRAPVVSSTDPANGEIGVGLAQAVSAVFSKAMDADSIDAATFTLSGPSGAVTGVVDYDEATRTATFTPASSLEALTQYTATLSTAIEDIHGINLESAVTWSFTTGQVDLTPPTIASHTPADGAVDVPVSSRVSITFSEEMQPGSLVASEFILTGPYGETPVTFGYDPVTFTVTLTPSTDLLPTEEYTVFVPGTVKDSAGNALGEPVEWSFTTATEPPMQAFFGDLHNHTSYSDGSGTPAQALSAGKAAGFDFMAISDHSYAIDDVEWANTLTAVEAATSADFVGLRGFEYTQGAEGHINVWNSARHAVRTNTGCAFCDYTPNLEAGSTVNGFYPWLVSTSAAALDGSGIVMQFNHPGWINFSDWFYHPEVAGVARLEEVGNGSGTSYVFSEEEYLRSLDYGWKLGATNNADTHSIYWGLNTDHRTGVLMPELTKAALLDALRLRRTFATEDKNASLSMKANGAWMGSEIANTGSIQFVISGSDPDGEPAHLVQLITDQGKVAASYLPGTASFAWEPAVAVTSGVHFFYVKVTQNDGDDIVTSPVWTMGTEDISVTDIVIQPTIPTIYSPTLITARVTNRVAQARTVNLLVNVNGVPLGTAQQVTVPANGDGYANFSWQPDATGEMTITAEIQDTPDGDNPDDNSAALELTVTDAHLPLILIDAGHGNLNATGNEMKAFVNDLSDHHYNVLKNLDALTEADLNPDVVKLLIITAPETAYTNAERTAIGNFVNAGGSLWLGGLADYTGGSISWAATVADRENAILDSIETVTGQQINMRMNDDEVIDADDNNGYVFGVIWGDFPAKAVTGIGVNVEQVSTWSLSSIRGRTVNDPLTAETPGVQIVMQGDLDEGYGSSPWYDPYHTSNENADNQNDAYIYNPGWTHPATRPADAIPVPGAAVTDLTGAAGRIMLYGDSNDPFTTFAYTAGDGKQNELFNLQSIMYLLGEQLQKSTVAQARAQAVEDQPDNLDKLVWVEGEITAAYGEFFNVLYLRDETGGITVHAPAGDIDASNYTRGTKVRAIGTIGTYNGDTEIEFFEAEMVQVLEPSAGEPEPEQMSTTYQASLEANEGRLVVVEGTVLEKDGADTLLITDGTGLVRVFLDGYNGSFANIQPGMLVRVTGLASEDGDGQRIRVRNYKMHSQYADDVRVVGSPLYLPFVLLGSAGKEK